GGYLPLGTGQENGALTGISVYDPLSRRKPCSSSLMVLVHSRSRSITPYAALSWLDNSRRAPAYQLRAPWRTNWVCPAIRCCSPTTSCSLKVIQLDRPGLAPMS